MAINGYNRNYNRNYKSGSAYPRRKRRNRKRLRNRIIIVTGFLMVLILIALLFSLIIKGCTGGSKEKSGETVPAALTDGSGDAPAGDGVLVWNGGAYQSFNGTGELAAAYANAVNDFKRVSGFEIYCAVVPDSTEICLAEQVKAGGFSTASQKDFINAAYSRLADGIRTVDCADALSQHSGEYIYFNSDSRCTALGAYFVYKAFAQSAGQQTLSLDDCNEEKITGYKGALYRDGVDEDSVSYFTLPYNVSMEITAKGKTESYESPYITGEKSPKVFINGDNPLTVLESNNAGDEKIVLVKDGFGNALAPYLSYNYGEVHIIDFRYWEGSLTGYCVQNGIDKALFVSGVATVNDEMQIKALEAVLN